MHLRFAPLIVALVAVAPALSGCREAPRGETAPLVLVTYDVPPGSLRPLTTMIKDTLRISEGKEVGRATATPDGRLAVLAPDTVQIGVQKLVAEVVKHPATPDQTIDIHYYVVVGTPSATPGALPEGTTEVRAALEEIQKTQGPQTFRLEERVTLATLNDEKGTVQTNKMQVQQLAVQANEGVYARVEMSYTNHNHIDTRVFFAPGKTVALGAAGQHVDDGPAGSTLYYLVRATARDGKQP